MHVHRMATAWPPHVHCIHIAAYTACTPQAPSKARAASGGGGGGGAMGDMFFTMMDKDKDGTPVDEYAGKLVSW